MDLRLVTSVDDDNPDENDVYIDPATGDVMWFGQFEDIDADEVAQHIRMRLRMWRGEWFLNADEGVPYLDEILEKGIDDGSIGAILKAVILGAPGVATINSLSLKRDNAARTLNVTFEAVLDSGHVLNSDDFDVPFVVEV